MSRVNVACVALVVGLTSCASAPKKPAPAPLAKIETAPAVVAPAGPRVSPYAPAQEDLSKRGDYVRGGLYAPHIADAAPAVTIDVDAIPEPEVVQLPRSRYGNRSPYAVLDKQYTVLASTRDYVETGTASYYGTKFHGRRTSNQEVYDMYAFSAAHRSLPLPSFARVTNLETGKSVIVRVNDRGPFHHGRLIDLSYAAAVKLGITRKGTGRVEVRALQADGSQPGTVYASRASQSGTPTPPSLIGTTGTPADGVAAPAVAALDVAVEARTPMTPSAMDELVSGMPIANATVAAAATATATTASLPASVDYRFDMSQDGRAMSASEFEAWMRSRQVRVATGRPGTPDPAPPVIGVAEVAAVPSTARVSPAIAPVPSTAGPATWTPALTASPGASTGAVTVQIASFGARSNAERALSMLRDAGITDARLHDGQAAGKAVYRLRVGTDDMRIAELSSRIVGLGFGTPQRVRD